MKNTFAPWQRPIEESKLRVLETVSRIAQSRETPFLIFGAFARELHFTHQYGIECARRTNDVDFGLQLSDWEAYQQFRFDLKKEDFESDNPEHPEKMTHRETGQEIDLLPFGEIAKDGEHIIWPSDNSPWSILGFDEAYLNAWTFELNETKYRVVSLPMLVTLKIVAIMDREAVRHKKDGTDIAFVLEKYLEVGNRQRLLNGSDADLMELSGDDLDVASARLLGRDMARSMDPRTLERITTYINKQVESRSHCYLIHGLMESSYLPRFPEARERLRILLRGLEDANENVQQE